MFSFYKVIFFAESIEDIETSKRYYDKCYEGLKTLNERSNRVSLFILFLILLCLFGKYFTTIKIYDNKVDIQLFKILTPTLLTYFILEWVMIAKRRRDLIFALQQSSYKIFSISPTEEERYFPGFNPNTLNIIPYTLMGEILTIDNNRRFTPIMRIVSILTIFFTLVLIVGISFVDIWRAYDLQFSFIYPASGQILLELCGFYVCSIFSLQCLIWICYHYYIEIQNIIEPKKLKKQLAKGGQPKN